MLNIIQHHDRLQVFIKRNCVLNVSTIINSKPKQQNLKMIVAAEDIFLLKPSAQSCPFIRSLEYMKGKVDAERIFIPRPEQFYRPVKGMLSLKNNQLFNYFFAPPPQIFCLKSQSGWLGIGLGDIYNSEGVTIDLRNSFSIKFNCLQGDLPEIILVGGETEWDVLTKYGRFLQDTKKVKKPQPIGWHKNPIYCTWGDQMRDTFIGNIICDTWNVYSMLTSKFEKLFEKLKYLHTKQNTNFGFQQLFTKRLNHKFITDSVKRIKAKGWPIGTIILDADWMEYYGEPQAHPKRFPCITDTISYLHSQGFKVIAWYPNWWIHPESGTAKKHPEWIIQDITGKPTYKFDVTQPEVRKHIRTVISTIIYDYGFDGLKLDYGYDSPRLTDRLADPSFATGDRLALKLQKLLYEAAHTAKEDALVIGISPNPFFAQYSDMIRLNDNFYHNISSQITRARIANTLCPGYLIDSDGYNHSDKRIVEYYRNLSQLCVPSLYYCKNLGLTHQQETELREILGAYKQKCNM